ncbi:hypothetical protein [Desertibacillus haloalkaliphilus]|uniref:hypothetical protein n=1 Tax=Desertibacillus haloalkaliphilus TaxID=1328930 RepID=UPI001C26A9F2|nr:hypothetical protein [Desertibacillus haloalkaliphilus]MBU8908469.1 hypothetical protein [Desertibacillus haloalkaliphilus]
MRISDKKMKYILDLVDDALMELEAEYETSLGDSMGRFLSFVNGVNKEYKRRNGVEYHIGYCLCPVCKRK